MKNILILLTVLLIGVFSIYPKTEIDKKLYYLKYITLDESYLSHIDYNTEYEIEEQEKNYIIKFKGGLPKRFITEKELLDASFYIKDLNEGNLYLVEQEITINKDEIDKMLDPSELVLARILSYNSGEEYNGVKTIKEISKFNQENLKIGNEKLERMLIEFAFIGIMIMFIGILTFIKVIKVFRFRNKK